MAWSSERAWEGKALPHDGSGLSSFRTGDRRKSLVRAAQRQRPPAVADIYTFRSFASSGRIVAVQRLSAETDEEALAMAREMVKGASAAASFDLWQDDRCIEGEAPTTRKGKPRRLGAAGR
jgi:hypothetical protein